MKQTVIGYIYSSKIGRNGESFLKIAKMKDIDVILFDISAEIDERNLAEMDVCDVIYNDSGEDYAIFFTKIFESMGKIVVESSKAFYDENKWNTFVKCKKFNIPTPRTILLSNDIEIAKQQLIEFCEWPVIIKRVIGTWGEFVRKAENLDQAVLVIQELFDKGGKKFPLIAQQFVESSSYRVTFIGKEIVQTAIKENNSWKCTGVYARNFKRFDVDDDLKEIVNKIMDNFNINICGIDLHLNDGKWYVIEVNTEPALDFFEDEREILINKIIDLLVKISQTNKKAYPNVLTIENLDKTQS